MTQEYHYGLIVTKKKAIEQILEAKSQDILRSIVFCIYAGPEHALYNLNLLAASMNLFIINTLIYKGSDGYKKLPKRYYEIELFENFAENIEEVGAILRHLGFYSTCDEAEYVYNVLYAIKPLILEWLTLTQEIAYVPEFAYHIDYCIRNKVENLPKPYIKDFAPLNYPTDFKISCNEGIVKNINDIVSFR